MAPRKPKGIDLPSPGDVVNWMRGVHDTAMVASGDKAAVGPGSIGVRNLGRGISMLNQGVNPYAKTTEKALGYAVGKPGSGTQLIKSMATDAAITAATAGVVKNFPKIANWVKPKDIGIHLSPINDIKQILPNINANRGARETFNFPLVKNQTYKLSSVDVNNVKMKPSVLVDSAEEYSGAFAGGGDSKGFINAYVTRSKLGKPDPEVMHAIGKTYTYGDQRVSINGLNSRTTPRQDVVGNVKVWAPSDFEEPHGYFPKNQKEELVKVIQSEKKKELARSIARGSVVGAGVAGISKSVIAKRK